MKGYREHITTDDGTTLVGVLIEGVVDADVHSDALAWVRHLSAVDGVALVANDTGYLVVPHRHIVYVELVVDQAEDDTAPLTLAVPGARIDAPECPAGDDHPVITVDGGDWWWRCLWCHAEWNAPPDPKGTDHAP